MRQESEINRLGIGRAGIVEINDEMIEQRARDLASGCLRGGFHGRSDTLRGTTEK
jgi:hypothetical protein